MTKALDRNQTYVFCIGPPTHHGFYGFYPSALVRIDEL